MAIVMGILWEKINEKMIKRQIEIFEENALYLARLSNSILVDVKNVSLLIYNDEKTMDILEKGVNVSEEEQNLLNGKVSAIFFSNDEIYSVAFYVEEPQIMIYRKRNQSNRFYKVTTESELEHYFINEYNFKERKYSISTVHNEETQEFQLILNQNIMDQMNHVLVRMEIVYDHTVFEPVFSKTERDKYSCNFILDDKNQFLYEEFGEYFPDKIGEELKDAPEGISYIGIEYCVIKTGLEKFPYKIVKCISMQALSEDMVPYRNSILIVFLVIMVIIAIVALVLSKLIRKPIRKFTQSIIELRNSGRCIDSEIQSDITEMDELAVEFCAMMKEIDYLIEEEGDARYKEKKAFMKMLTVQLNPHFLYNALQTLQYMALQRNAFEINGMLTSLGKILRYCLDWETDEVTLEEELENALDYLNIQKYRYVDELKLQVERPDRIPECYMPKMILQPLVENCFVHGFKGQAGDYRIKIHISCANGEIVMKVCDNGKGMEEAERMQYMQKMERMENYNVSSHTGLLNLNYRLRQKYPQATVSIEQNEWFCVEIRITGGYNENFDHR